MLQDEESGLWRSWRIERDSAARERLIRLHMGYACALAAKAFSRRYNDEFEFAEYMQCATIGLLEAVDRFDPQYPASFRTFATPRIQGAILDGIERLSEQQQQISARQRILAERAASVCGERADDLFRQLAETAIGLAVGYLLEGSSMYQSEEPTLPDNGYSRLELRQLQERVRGLVEKLPEREKLVIKYHYLNHLQFETIAQIFSVSKGRVSQIHKRALAQLRDAASRVHVCDLAW
ncbi:MAG TPA: sigma-70 family RNA polymerase sigma factor [Paucimonas sp.]|nr:sigma-70 family RNA polymerase sigma factor [Paucimonas sp.]